MEVVYSNEPAGHKKTVSESETVAGQQSEKSNGSAKGKISKTNKDEGLTVLSRLLAEQGSALRQQVFWLKHGAKLRHCYVSLAQVRQKFPLRQTHFARANEQKNLDLMQYAESFQAGFPLFGLANFPHRVAVLGL